MSGDTPSLESFATDPHPLLHQLRDIGPISWAPSLDAWLVTSHQLCVEVMRDPDTFTVDDTRFSTRQVIGPNMLSLDGPEHRRHRDPFGEPFRTSRIRELEGFTRDTAEELFASTRGVCELRAEVAAPLAVAVMTRILGLAGVETEDVLRWYEDIVDAVHVVTTGGGVPAAGLSAFADLEKAVTRSTSSSDLLTTVEESGDLTPAEIASNVAVLLFGGIVTAESTTAIALRYLLSDPELKERVATDRELVRPFVEEVLRIEPSASAVDRYTTRDVTIGAAAIPKGDLVRVSLAAANRDPSVFADPDRFDIDRTNHSQSLTFARGPHACLGAHLARLETAVAVETFLDHPAVWRAGELDDITGLVFRVPETVMAVASKQ
jgi:cytochrome P450